MLKFWLKPETKIECCLCGSTAVLDDGSCAYCAGWSDGWKDALAHTKEKKDFEKRAMKSYRHAWMDQQEWADG